MTAGSAPGAGGPGRAGVNGTTVAFVGLGAMGMPMAKNLLAAGFPLRGFDVRAAAVQALAGCGASGAGSPVEAMRGADIAVLMVVNAAQAEEVLFADDGAALAAMAADGVVVLMATCAPGAVEAMADRVLASGRRFVDAPVSGGVVGATAAALTIMAAAPLPVFEAVKPLFDALGDRDKIYRVGERAGQGATVKTVNQLLCGVHIAVAAEALSLAAKVGVDPRTVLQILGRSSAASWMLNDRGPRMLEQEPDVTSAVDIFVKDLAIVLEAGRDGKAALPFASLAHQLFLSVSGRGAGQSDDSQVIRAFHALNGTSSDGE